MADQEQSKGEKGSKFEAIFPSLVKDLKDNATQFGIFSEALKWYEEVRLPDSPASPQSPAPLSFPNSHAETPMLNSFLPRSH